MIAYGHTAGLPLARQLLPLVLCICSSKANIPELANHHSASRVIQWCLKEASAADKERLTSEIKANFVEISKSKYGRFVV